MTRKRKWVLYTSGVICLLAAMVAIKAVAQKRTVAALVTRARYAVNLVDATTSQTNQIPQCVAQKIATRIKDSSSSRIMGKKSVCYGIVNLYDSDWKPILSLSVLKYPLFQFDGIQKSIQAQLELKYDLVAALGFRLHGYNPSSQAK